ncbi:uncharacterized protein [Zea mays]|uniref:uncharacterized protein isoform X2 n=1 Tax=Zea mays TaxID=4577 RepID=UPI0009A9524C|nr:uncharacterized protein LOC109945528 isoform X2 [Zea mays]XP_020408149.1 uncharacterized protein LOC109946024 isoform X1 [Zea mays]|eukprot:XP_020407435.1 uncharacterized protein LOC109945528 isoform X2 [Zea mays]
MLATANAPIASSLPIPAPRRPDLPSPPLASRDAQLGSLSSMSNAYRRGGAVARRGNLRGSPVATQIVLPAARFPPSLRAIQQHPAQCARPSPVPGWVLRSPSATAVSPFSCLASSSSGRPPSLRECDPSPSFKESTVKLRRPSDQAL